MIIRRLEDQLKKQGEALGQYKIDRMTEDHLREKITKLENDLEKAKSTRNRSPSQDAASDEMALSETQEKLRTANNDLQAKRQELKGVTDELGKTRRKLSEEQSKLSKAKSIEISLKPKLRALVRWLTQPGTKRARLGINSKPLSRERPRLRRILPLSKLIWITNESPSIRSTKS